MDRIYSVKLCTIDKMFAIANFFCYHNIRIKSRGSRYFMNFSLEWFTSIPGLLITAGILLILIALIYILVSNRKKKDKPSEGTGEQTPAAQAPTATPAAPTQNNGAVPEMNSPAVQAGTIMDIPAPVETQPQTMDPTTAVAATMPAAPAVNPVDPMAQATVEAMPTAQPAPVEVPTVDPMAVAATTQPTTPEVAPVAPTPVEPVTPAMPTVEQAPVTPEVAPIAPTPVENTVAPIASVEAAPQPEPVAPIAPVVEPETPVAPEVTPTPVEPVAPVMPTVEPSAPVVEPTPVAPQPEVIQPPQPGVIQPVQPVADTTQQQGPVIYGGANPIVPEINIQEPQHQIYGGANPLENTQSIPIANLVGPGQQTTVQTPTAEPTIVTPQPVQPVENQTTNVGQ